MTCRTFLSSINPATPLSLIPRTSVSRSVHTELMAAYCKDRHSTVRKDSLGFLRFPDGAFPTGNSKILQLDHISNFKNKATFK